MIPATQPYSAQLRHPANEALGIGEAVITRPILAWDDEGFGLVHLEYNPRLVRAEEQAGFLGISADAQATVGVAPGGGWLIEYRDPEGAVTISPVIGWAVQADGNGFALDVAEDGNCIAAGRKKNFARIYYPDHDPERSEDGHSPTV